jgi:hypothetical protein
MLDECIDHTLYGQCMSRKVEIVLEMYALELDNSKWIVLEMFARELDNSKWTSDLNRSKVALGVKLY